MRTLVVLAVVGVCSAFVRDAPDVAAEKARFYQAFKAAERASAPHLFQQGGFVPQQAYNQAPAPHYQPKWTGPVAATVPAGVNGRLTPVSDTADVAAARQNFLNAYQAQVKATVGAAVPTYQNQYNAIPAHNRVHAGQQYQPKWTGPVAATVPAGLPGSTNQVAETPEVQAAKASFFNSYQRQVAAAAPPSPTWG